MVRFLALVLLISLSAAGVAQDAGHISVEMNQNGMRVSGDAEVRVSRAVAWEVLTDYEGWVRFMPDLQISRVVSREPLRLAQRGSAPWLPGIPLVVLSSVAETPKERVSFSKIQGNLLFLEGEWRLTGKDGALRLSYRAELIPGFPLPSKLTAEVVQADTRAKLEAMAHEMTRRGKEGSAKEREPK